MSDALSIVDPNDGVTYQPISNGERLKLSFTKCHYKTVAIGLGDKS